LIELQEWERVNDPAGIFTTLQEDPSQWGYFQPKKRIRYRYPFRQKGGIGQNLEGSAKTQCLRTSAHRLGLRKKLGINGCHALTRQVI